MEASDPVRGVVIHHSDTVKSVVAHLDALFDSARPPTALIVGNPKYVFIITIHLMKRGLSVPRDVSLVARDTGAFFTEITPPITHYRIDVDSFTARLTRLMLNMAGQRELPRKPILVFPQLFQGGSVKKITPGV